MCVSILKIINLGTVHDLSKQTGLAQWKINGCLESLQNKLLITNEEDAQVYKITEKGKEYLKSYNKIIELLSFKLNKREEILA